MVSSMTGYGKETQLIEKTSIMIEIRSVNHRFLDVMVKMPRSFLFLEDKLKKIAQSYFQRGRIEIYVGLEGDNLSRKKLTADWELMDQYMEQLNEAKRRYELSGELPLSVMTTIPDFFQIQETQEDTDEFHARILNGTEKACKQVSMMRMEEGDYLAGDLAERLETIHAIITGLSNRRDAVRREYQDKIRDRVSEYLDGSMAVDDARIHQEIVLLADKGDITEEITRLKSHREHFKRTLGSKEASGRKLDFITQEMHREANTIGSKSTDAKIGEWTVLLKSEIEKMKEQVQNIE
ncbi:YicC/YloC family endoribonuclease [Oceanobacillus saliphilus]|uniref:YicC/YloC family endoribonuclease n=1 Tax=Oceanobacillus saliphilus TaxID=2925834 RepID=UPI00201DFE61|nr:YicC/YloC family endoribonuclease [Oceanobacillus saliphilus]